MVSLDGRMTRARSKTPRLDLPSEVIDLTQLSPSAPITALTQSAPLPTITTLPDKLLSSRTGLSARSHRLLLKKQTWLRTYTATVPGDSQNLEAALDASLVFAQEEAGTAVCISQTGLLLTCSHCIADSADEFDEESKYWLLFSSGRVVETKCIAWDPVRDLALLQVVAAQAIVTASTVARQTFPFIQPAAKPPKLKSPLGCVGHPGSEDLEAAAPGVRTNYDVLHVSTGRFRGYAKGQDLQDNSEIGALKHDCWTYWGHSGAPLVEQATGRLVGLHSSWDDETGMRRGVSFEAIKAFLAQHGVLSRSDDT